MATHTADVAIVGAGILDAARRKLREAGAHYVAGAVADCIPLVDRIEERLAKGERP